MKIQAATKLQFFRDFTNADFEKDLQSTKTILADLKAQSEKSAEDYEGMKVLQRLIAFAMITPTIHKIEVTIAAVVGAKTVVDGVQAVLSRIEKETNKKTNIVQIANEYTKLVASSLLAFPLPLYLVHRSGRAVAKRVLQNTVFIGLPSLIVHIVLGSKSLIWLLRKLQKEVFSADKFLHAKRLFQKSVSYVPELELAAGRNILNLQAEIDDLTPNEHWRNRLLHQHKVFAQGKAPQHAAESHWGRA
uniref:Uncharacterized protein n=1 Tax=viral metagenome TaxID=1070528 RepID=A0A6C0C1R3_9ZZZZ